MKYLSFLFIIVLFSCNNKTADTKKAKLDSLYHRSDYLSILNRKQRDSLSKLNAGDSLYMKINNRNLGTNLDIKRTDIQIDIEKK